MSARFNLPIIKHERVPALTLSSETFLEQLRHWSNFQYLLPYFAQFSCCSYGMENLYRSGEIEIAGKNIFCSVQPVSRQADILIVGGVISKKLSPYLLEVYQEMLFPRWVISVGACASAGGPFKSYAIEAGLSALFPVDVYVPGCPPTEKAIIEGLRILQKRVEDRQCSAVTEPDMISRALR
ncbi:MAG: NADH-quinone oxidoreductase subunit NuoB [Bdellovibrio sp.]|nr:NADH-quinone oxidoreductase subunit NuoB [Bdellovibrio sp.]